MLTHPLHWKSTHRLLHLFYHLIYHHHSPMQIYCIICYNSWLVVVWMPVRNQLVFLSS